MGVRKGFYLCMMDLQNILMLLESPVEGKNWRYRTKWLKRHPNWGIICKGREMALHKNMASTHSNRERRVHWYRSRQVSSGGEGEPVRLCSDCLLSGSDRRQVHQECVRARTKCQGYEEGMWSNHLTKEERRMDLEPYGTGIQFTSNLPSISQT